MWLILTLLFSITAMQGCNAAASGAAGNAPLSASSKITQGYSDAAFDGSNQQAGSFLVCGSNGRLDRIYQDKTVENIAVPASGKDLKRVLVGSGVTLAGGASGTLLYSRDGKVFKQASGAGKEDILGLAAFKGAYYACTSGGNMLSSADGASWKTVKRLTDKPLIAVASEGSYIMAITADTDIYKSQDGQTWSLQNYNKAYDGLAPKLSFINLQAQNGNFFLIAHPADSPTVPAVMYSSSGGEIWSAYTFQDINNVPPENFYPMTINSVCVFTDELMAACDGGRVLTITSCMKCNKIETVAKSDLRCIASGGNFILAAGDNFEYYLVDAQSLRQDKIAPEQALADFQAGAVIIDVRTDEEYNQSHIKGCIHIPVDQIESKLQEQVPDRGTELIFYCKSGARAQTALETAQQLGYQNVYNLGGLSDWPYDTE